MRSLLTIIGRWYSQRLTGNSKQPLHILLSIGCLLAAIALSCNAIAAPIITIAIPDRANTYKRTLIREAQYVWGLSAPTATFAAQLHQESSWNAEAVSYVGARGMSQFMPKTAGWAQTVWPELAAHPTYSPEWAIRAMLRYDKHLWDNTSSTATPCDRMALTLRAYNGGEIRLARERAMCARTPGCDPAQAWAGLDQFNAGRSLVNHVENTFYPRRILKALTPVYVKAGWGLGSCS